MAKLYVIKTGGLIIDDDAKLSSFLAAFAAIRENKILVHGGGKLATVMAEKTGIDQKFVEGRRITDAETLKIVTMVYAGYINKNIVAQLQVLNCNAIGICGADGNLLLAHKRQHPTIDYGFAGDIDRVNISLLKVCSDNDLTAVVAPVTADLKGQLLNTNADTVAYEIARALSAFYDVSLIYTFEKNGVLQNPDDDSSVIPIINPAGYRELKRKNLIFAGMLPKLENAFAALNSGVKKVIIGNAEKLNELLDGKSGTHIVSKD
jgi:acetylglutamate kinase